jgi:hypothetical protein
VTYQDIESYYHQQWGDPSREALFETDELALRVLKWSAAAATGGVNLYATVGVSNHPPTSAGSGHRKEFFIGFTPECDDIAWPLAQLAGYSCTSGKELGPGHIYRAPDSLLPSGAFSGFALITPLQDWYEPVLLSDGRHVDLLMAIPMFNDELDFAARRGVDDLLDVMSERAVPFWKPVRHSVFDEVEYGKLRTDR